MVELSTHTDAQEKMDRTCSRNILRFVQAEGSIVFVPSWFIPCYSYLQLPSLPNSVTIRERIAFLSHIPQRTILLKKFAIFWPLRTYVEVLETRLADHRQIIGTTASE